MLASPYVPTQTSVTTTLPLIALTNFLDPVRFSAAIISASDAVLLGPSDGAVLFSVAGSNAFSFVPKTVLGTAQVGRNNAIAGSASITLQKDSAGLTLLPGFYNITAEFSGSLDGKYQASTGSSNFRISITSPPVQWGVKIAT